MTRKKLLTVLRVTIAVVTLAAVVYAVARNWSDVSVHLDKISLATFAWSTLAAAIGTWLTMLGWRTILRDLGSDLHLAPASGVYFVGQLGKYLPGSLWSVLVQADIAANLKVPRRRTAVTGLLALGFALLTGFLVGLPAASFLLNGSSEGFDWWLLLALPLLVVLCVPRLLNALIAFGLRLLRRPPLEHALSVSLGMLTIVLPAGLGAREGLLTLILATAMPTPAAAAVAIMSRFIVTIVDVLVALGGWLYAKSHHLVSARRDAVADEEDLTV